MGTWYLAGGGGCVSPGGNVAHGEGGHGTGGGCVAPRGMASPQGAQSRLGWGRGGSAGVGCRGPAHRPSCAFLPLLLFLLPGQGPGTAAPTGDPRVSPALPAGGQEGAVGWVLGNVPAWGVLPGCPRVAPTSRVSPRARRTESSSQKSPVKTRGTGGIASTGPAAGKGSGTGPCTLVPRGPEAAGVPLVLGALFWGPCPLLAMVRGHRGRTEPPWSIPSPEHPL